MSEVCGLFIFALSYLIVFLAKAFATLHCHTLFFCVLICSLPYLEAEMCVHNALVWNYEGTAKDEVNCYELK